MKKWNLEIRDLADLSKHSKNPRLLTKDDAKHLKVSISKFGLIDKPIITQDGTIIGGHQRIEILKSLGFSEVECWVCNEDLTDDEVDELNIRLNKNTGEFDYEILANEWEPTDLLNWGFTQEELGVVQEKKKDKTKVVFEFEDPAHLENYIHDVVEKATVWNAKIKVKLPK